ncbi:hypothetical protein EGW08_021986 [Elysia chlorotica]|uniref:Pherophorin domain-containing protein n=1 Tax=Elysia chlorotica TaxID=188477 RepID=A0A433SM68_ELYCH|nr:hypothetical protein EGW08_021986 [Elysia chlorotica]
MALYPVQILLLLTLIAEDKALNITLLKFESTHSCRKDFLVENEDFMFFVYEFTGSSAIYGHDAFTGPKIYHTRYSSTVPHNPCNVFEVVTPFCQDKLGVPFQCSCFELTAGDHYRTEFNMTALVDFSKESVWLQWPGPPPINSVNTTLPEIRAKCPPPIVTLQKIQAKPSCSRKGFSVVLGGSTTISFEISKSTKHYIYDSKLGPELNVESRDGVHRHLNATVPRS